MKLGSYVKISSGFPIESASFNSEGRGVRVIRIRDVLRGDTETFSTQTIDSKYLISKGDILIAMDGSFHVQKWQSSEALLNQRVCKIESKDESVLNNDFLFFLLPRELKRIEDNTPFVTVKHLSVKSIQNIEIDLPNLRSQQQIVAALLKIEGVISNRQKSIELLDELLKAKFLQMFGDPVLNEKGWPKYPMKKVTVKIGSGSTPRGGKDVYQDEGISFIRSLNVYDNSFKYKDLAHINEEQAEKLKSVTLELNDVLFNITGASVCRATIVPEQVLPARVNQHVAILRPRLDKLKPRFLLHALISRNSKLDLLRIGQRGGATREAITKDQLESHLIIVPDIDLQTEFEAYALQIEKTKSLQISQLEKVENLFDSMRNDAFNGNLELEEKLSLEAILYQYQIDEFDDLENQRNDELVRMLANSPEMLRQFKSRFESHSFDNMKDYDKSKTILFEILKRPEAKISQAFNEKSKMVILQ